MKAALQGDWSKFDMWDDSPLHTVKGGSGGGSRYKASWVAQFRAVLWRSWLSVIKEPMLIKVRLLQTVVRMQLGKLFMSSFKKLGGLSLFSVQKA